MKFLYLFFIFALFFQSDIAAAQSDLPPIVKKAEQYLQDLKTVEARFVQRAEDGSVLYGTFYLNRPGRLRFEYDDPIDDFIVADGYFIYFYDAELGEQSNAPIGQTLADFLLRKKLRFGEELSVQDVRQADGIVDIRLVQSGDTEAGALILSFSKDPFQLRGWSVVDGMGYTTQTELMALRIGIKLDDSLFIYQDPNRFEDFRVNQ